jgi:putative MATE family efflux protein
LSISSKLFRLALPIIGLNVLAVLALAIDTAMCGHLPDADRALKALGYATQIVFLLMVLMMGLSIGAIALVARAYGAGIHERVNHLLFQSSMLTVIVGVSFGAAGNLLAPALLDLLGASRHVQGDALAFLRPMLGFIVFNYLNLLYAGILRSVGNTRLPFLIALAATAINVLVNYGLILGHWGLPAMGVAGAAWGTVAAQVFSVVAMVIAIRRGVVSGLWLPLKSEPIDRPLAKEMFSIGAPAAIDMVIMNVGSMTILGMLAHIDENTVAAHNVGLRVQSLAFVPGLGVAQATGALVGQALGARDADGARAVVRASLVLCTSVMTGLAVLLLVFDTPILAVFDVKPTTEVGAYTLTWMKVLAGSMPMFGVHLTFAGLLSGAGATRISLLINLLTTTVVQLPFAWLLAFPLGLLALGVWLSLPLAFAAKALLYIGVYRRGAWATLGAHVR